MNHPVMVVPGAFESLIAFSNSAHKAGLPKRTIDLVHLRASQINGCSVCVKMHADDMKQNGESDDRIFTVAAWREAPYFTDAERAALALTEAVTRLSDRSDPVPGDVWDDATDQFDETSLGALLVAIASINVWNRLNAATRQVAGVMPG
jgi:AhpD family alkylhydroperoxidase